MSGVIMLMRLLLAAVIACLWIAGAQAQSFAVKNPPTYTGDALGAGWTFGGVATTLYAPTISAYNIGLPRSTSLWVKYPTLATSGTPYFINNQNAAANAGTALVPKVSDSSGYLLQAFLVPPTPLPGDSPLPIICSGPEKMCAPIAAISDGALHHLCVVWTPYKSTFYIDGVQRAWGATGARLQPNDTDLLSLGLGVPSGTVMNDVAIWHRVLRADECALIHNRGLANKNAMSGNVPASLATSLIAWWRLSDCAGSPVVCPDSSSTNNPILVDPAPTLAITAPTDGTTNVTGSMSITATCTDTFSVTKVDFLVDGNLLSTDTSSPYAATMDTTLLLDARNPHSVTAVCTNQAGVTSTVTNSFTTNNGVVAPKSYYLNVAGNGGSDSNDGLAAVVGGGHGPWLTPNHNIRCGDSILAQPAQDYNANNFAAFGRVWSCPSPGAITGPFYARLRCQLTTGLHDCYIHPNAVPCCVFGMRINQDNWSIENWHITAGGVTQCIRQDPIPGKTFPPGYSSTNDPTYVFPHYLRILNNYLDSCGRSGPPNMAGYIVTVGNLIYNSAYNSANICDSGITGGAPFDLYPADTGTHDLIAGNFIINNYNPPHCTDGEGIIVDDYFLGNNTDHPDARNGGYSGQMYFTQNLIFGNSSYGYEINVQVFHSQGASMQLSVAKKYMTHSTLWGNGLGYGPGFIDYPTSHGAGGSEIGFSSGNACGSSYPAPCTGDVSLGHMYNNIAVYTAWRACVNRTAPYTCPPGGSSPGATVGGGCGDCIFESNWLWNSMVSRHPNVRLATAAVLTTAGSTYNNGVDGVGATITRVGNGPLVVDGVTPNVADRILVKNEVDKTRNGIYVVTAVGSSSTPWVVTRATDADTAWDIQYHPWATEVPTYIPARVDKLSYGIFVRVTAGNTLINKYYYMSQGTPDPGHEDSFTTFGVSKIQWTEGVAPIVSIPIYYPLINYSTNVLDDPLLAAPAQFTQGGLLGEAARTLIDCSHSMTTHACMQTAGLIAGFLPTASGTEQMGYRPPSATCFAADTPGFELDYTLWPQYVKGSLGASGTYVTLPCGWE